MMFNMMWYDDPSAQNAMARIGLVEAGVGSWISPDGLRELADFEGGIVMITRLWHDKPEFDIRTLHFSNHRDANFFNECLSEHITAISVKTNDIKQRGVAALKTKPSD